MAKIDDPGQLFEYKLGAALGMEDVILDVLQRCEKEASDETLKQQFAQHRQETEQQIANLEEAFSALGSKPQKQSTPAIQGLQREAKEMIGNVSGELVDSVLIGGAAEIEHHEIAVYEGLITKAEAMGAQEVVALLQENLEQEQATLKKVQAASQQHAQQVAQQTV